MSYRTALERKQEIRDLYTQYKDVGRVAKETDFSASTVRRICGDLIKDHNLKHGQLNQEKIQRVVCLRQAAKTDPNFKLSVYAAEHGWKFATAEKALRGTSFKEINSIEAPFVKDIRKTTERAQARDLYKRGEMSVKRIAKKLNVSPSSVSSWCHDLILKKRKDTVHNDDFAKTLIKQARAIYKEKLSVRFVSEEMKVSKGLIYRWCEDLVAEKLAAERETKMRFETRPRARPVVNGIQILTDKNVLDTRKGVRASGEKKWRKYAERYGVNIATISMAVRGVSFKHLNCIEPPVFEDTPSSNNRIRGTWKKPNPDEKLFAEAILLMRSDPIKWTYATLAIWMKEKTGRRYQAGHMAIAMRNRDSGLRNLEPKPLLKQLTVTQLRQKAQAVATKRCLQKEKREAAKRTAELQKKAETLADDDEIDDETLARLIAEEDAFEEAKRLESQHAV